MYPSPCNAWPPNAGQVLPLSVKQIGRGSMLCTCTWDSPWDALLSSIRIKALMPSLWFQALCSFSCVYGCLLSLVSFSRQHPSLSIFPSKQPFCTMSSRGGHSEAHHRYAKHAKKVSLGPCKLLQPGNKLDSKIDVLMCLVVAQPSDRENSTGQAKQPGNLHSRETNSDTISGHRLCE